MKNCTPKTVARELQRISDAADAAEALVIAAIRSKYVIPFCNRKGWRFTAGMGSWSFDDGKGNYRFERDEIPARIYAMLWENSVTSRNGIGALMADYTPANYKRV
jgi:hypothetical protein